MSNNSKSKTRKSKIRNTKNTRKNHDIQPLNVISVIFNAASSSRRYELAREFIQRMERQEIEQKDICFHLVELVYGNQEFALTDANNPRHLQLRTEYPLWHKSNLINVGIQKLLPSNWKTVAWIDTDIEFQNKSWAKDANKLLRSSKDIVQLFEYVKYMEKDGITHADLKSSFAYELHKGEPFTKIHKSLQTLVKGIDGGSVPGFAWACNRKTYDKMGKIYDMAILGGNDKILVYSLMGKAIGALKTKLNYTEGYLDTIKDFQENVKDFRVGYVPGLITHQFHGDLKDRKYGSKHKILINNHYDPNLHITYDENGVLIPTDDCPPNMLEDIHNYFFMVKKSSE
jgi:hypothetical protein